MHTTAASSAKRSLQLQLKQVLVIDATLLIDAQHSHDITAAIDASLS